jgi:hypothetical protein
MSGTFRVLSAYALASLAALGACKDPTASAPTGAVHVGAAPVALNEDCPAGDDWLPLDGGDPPPVRMFDPPPHPDTECPFYRGAYQNFLIATTPLESGGPAIVRYATLDDAFTSATPHLVRNTGDPSADPYANPGGAAGAAAVRAGPATGRAWLGAILQAGQRNALIDQDHHTLYYGLHMNQAFVDFIKANGLNTVNGILNVDPNLEFPPGLVEFKTAWKDIDPRDFPDKAGQLGTPNGIVSPPGDIKNNPILQGDPGDYSNYITAMAWIPWLTQNPTSHIITEDRDHPVQRKMALVAIHCVYTLPGHPEFVWGSIQHVNRTVVDPAPLAYAGVRILGAPDSQPNTTGPGGVPALPNPMHPQNDNVTTPPSQFDYLLFKGGTPENAGNSGIPQAELVLAEASQSFTNDPSNVYRMFPGSKSNILQPDSAVFSLNSNLNDLFDRALAAKSIDPNVDKRQHYRLVAAVWMDKPALFGLGPDGQGASFQNDDTNPLVIAAKTRDAVAGVSQGAFCGTPLDSTDTSGDSPKANGTNNTVPGCLTRADDLALAGSPQPQNPPIDPSAEFANTTSGTDLEFSILGGEDRLSSTAMETFTQNGEFHNCFACHNTQPITTNGTPTSLAPQAAVVIPKAAKINVSHLFSEFVLREQEAAAAATSQ